MRRWRVAGGLVEREGEVLLVRNRRRHGGHDWSTPGGVVDAGESAVGALAREVREETGLTVADWTGPLYRVEVVAPDMEWTMTAEVFAGGAVVGDIVIDDPDGIVVEARWVPVAECGEFLSTGPRWVGEPFTSFVRGRAAADEPRPPDGVDPQVFAYRVGGQPPEVEVERLVRPDETTGEPR